MNDEAFLKKGFHISTDRGFSDFEMIHKYLSEGYLLGKGHSC